VKTIGRIQVHNPSFGKPAVDNMTETAPGKLTELTSAPHCPEPVSRYLSPEGLDARKVTRNSMIVQMRETIVNSSGNVFTDLGYSSDEAAMLQMHADLMVAVRKFIKTKKLTQTRAAEILGLSQPRVSDLIKGRWEKFSLEMLITLATRAGMHVRLRAAG
jgi:predicted XRE-type DNA-binding protein